MRRLGEPRQGEQSESLPSLHPAGQQPSPPWQMVIGSWAHTPSIGLQESMVHASASLQSFCMPLTQVPVPSQVSNIVQALPSSHAAPVSTT